MDLLLELLLKLLLELLLVLLPLLLLYVFEHVQCTFRGARKPPPPTLT